MREPTLPQFDAETYLMWESRRSGRFELHHGFVFAFAGGTLGHDRIAQNLRRIFDGLFPSPCRAFGSGVKVAVDASSYYYADAGVVCDDLPDDATVVERPVVLAEVASPSTRAYDLGEKRAAYRTLPSLRAYAIVSTASRSIELDLRRPDGAWSTVAYDTDDYPLGSGGTLAIADVYARTSIA